MDDQPILELIRTGSNYLAINALYQNFPAIRKLVRARGGSTRDAEDIFQEALLIFLNKARNPEFQLTAKLSTYLYSVCRFLWYDQLRKHRPHIPYDSGLTAAEITDFTDTIEQESRIRLAEQALNDLKDRCRELLLLFYQGQLSIKAIATKMGYGTEGSAKNQKYKCLEAARNRLKELQQQTQTF
jgi:RNA polymerase sigma factor (sigma-70 family)